jgi:choline monooxygenase
MPLVFPFDPNIARASTIPARLYNDPVYLELERERVFAHTWQLVGRVDLVHEHGLYFTAYVGNDSVVVLRDRELLRGFHNVCLHRAGPVASGCGKRNTLQCRYHGWTYNLDGSLRHAPEMQGVERWSPEDMHLAPVQVDRWGPLVFVNLDGKAPPLIEVLEDIPRRVAPFRCEAMRWVLRKEWEIACNWKVYVDNYLEGYHIPIVHPGLMKEIDYARYETETSGFWSLQHSPIKRRDGARLRSDPTQPDSDAQFYWVYPNLMLNVYPDNFSTNLIVPLSPRRTLTVFEWFFREPRSPAVQETVRQTIDFSDEIQREDIGICEAVQKGLESRTYDVGRFSVRRESGVHHFHRLYASALDGGR